MRLPNNWNEVKLRQFIHYLEYKDEKPETTEERFNLLYKRICAITDCSVEEARNLKVKDQSKLQKLFNTKLEQRLFPSFKLNGIRYRPIGSKSSFVDVRELDGERYTAIKQVSKRGATKYLHQILFLVCEPIKFGFYRLRDEQGEEKEGLRHLRFGWHGYEFKGNEVESRISDFKELPMKYANPLSVFFLTLLRELNLGIQDYLEDFMEKTMQEAEQTLANLETDTDG